MAWRQNDQTYDALTLKLGAIPRAQLFYSWVGNVNRVTGPDNGTFPGNLSDSTLDYADKFTTTPQSGVEDFYVGGSANFGDLAIQLIYHDFQAEAVNQDYGTEWDASVAYGFGARYGALLKYAKTTPTVARPARRHQTPSRRGCSSAPHSDDTGFGSLARLPPARDVSAPRTSTRLRSDRRRSRRD